MASITCFTRPRDADPERDGWEETAAPPYVSVRQGGVVLLELPASDGRRHPAAFVNGFPVVDGIQALRHLGGDLVRVLESEDAEVDCVVGGLSAGIEEATGRRCRLTGQELRGRAVRCPCGVVLATDVAEDVKTCPDCGRSLAVDGAGMARPAEALL